MSSPRPETAHTTRSRRLRLAVVTMSIASILATVSGVAARAPLTGAHNTGYSGNATLKFKFAGSSLPSWLTGAGKGARLVLETEWETYNRTAMPRFQYDSAGHGQVIWSSAVNSPCHAQPDPDPNPDWLACTPGAPAGTQDPTNPNDPKTYWKIYVRNFAASSKSNWAWSESGGCSGKTCFDLSRAVLHEAMHVFLGIGSHDNSGEAETIMGEQQPSSPATGWNRKNLQGCDVATGQLFYDLHLKTDAYAGCLKEITGMSAGLPTFVSMAATSFTVCYTDPFAATAQARVGTIPVTNNRLSLNPLDGRTIDVYRRPVGGTFARIGSVTAITTPTPKPNLTANLSVSTPSVYEYQLRFASDGTGLTQSLKASNGPIFKVNWSSPACNQ